MKIISHNTQNVFTEINNLIQKGTKFGEFGNDCEALRLFKQSLNLAVQLGNKQKVNEISSLINMYL